MTALRPGQTALNPVQVRARYWNGAEKSANFTAENHAEYVITGTCTVTDPTPAAGHGFRCLIINGTATIGGVTYSTAGVEVTSYYHSGAWVRDVRPTLGDAHTWTAAQTFRAASAVRSEAAATQDAVVLAGRAGGTSSYAVTITPTALTANRTLTAPDATGTIATTTDLAAYQPVDTDLTAIAGLSSNGIIARTGAGTVATRTVTAPAAGITVSNGDGVSGHPTLALANDLSAVEGLSGTGLAVRTASDTWTNRTLQGTSGQITVTNGSGVSADPTISLPATISQATTFSAGTASTGTGSGTVIISGSGGLGIGGQLTTRRFAQASATDSTNGNITALSSTDGQMRLTGTAPVVQGISAPAGEAQWLVIIGVVAFTVNNEDAAASSANRVITDTGGNVSFAANKNVILIYDPSASRWRMVRG